MIKSYSSRFKADPKASNFESIVRYGYEDTLTRLNTRLNIMAREAVGQTLYATIKINRLKQNKVIIDKGDHSFYRHMYVLKHKLNILTPKTACLYLDKGTIPAPLYTYEYKGRIHKYYSGYQVRLFNVTWNKKNSKWNEPKLKELHEKFKKDPLLKLYPNGRITD